MQVATRTTSAGEALHAEVERLLAAHCSVRRRVVRLERRVSPLRSSHPLEEVDAVLEDGTRLELLRKEPGTAVPDGVKPAFLRDALREIGVYRAVLEPNRLDAPVFYGVGRAETTSGPWLLLERVAGRELYQVGGIGAWQAAARWLGVLHARFEGFQPPEAARLLVRNAGFHVRWLRRARALARLRRESSDTRRALDSLEGPLRRAAGRLEALPRTLLHGEFYASNVLLEGKDGGARVRPVDWEMAALGPGVVDLAALTAGSWGQEQRERMVSSYRRALVGAGAILPDPDHLQRALQSARLCLAVQWLGWSARWSPPPAQARDWLAEALDAAARLGAP